MIRHATAIVALAGILGLVACNKSEGSGSGGPVTTTAEKTAVPESTAATGGGGGAINSAEAKEIFKTRCATCHGPEGRGDGPGAITLNPKPRNYHDKAWQEKVTDDDIRKTITYGGAAVGKSPIMPASPDLDSKPAVVDGLVKIVREFGKS